MSAKQSPASSLGGAKSIERNPAAIWLSPICDDEAHHGEGRTWAAPAPAETCEDCSEPWVRYVREDLALPSPSPAIVKEAGEVERSLHEGQWFYPEGDHSSDECRFSPDEVIDYALEGENVSRVVAIERAAALPTVYAAVRVYSDAEKDARGSDDEYDYTLFVTAEEARAALSASNAAQVSK